MDDRLRSELVSETEMFARLSLRGMDNLPFNRATHAIRIVFTAMWSSALSVERIGTIAEAMTLIDIDEEDLQKALTSLTKAKFLRSRLDRGLRLYEINLPN